jgi:hypothetical protein
VQWAVFPREPYTAFCAKLGKPGAWWRGAIRGLEGLMLCRVMRGFKFFANNFSVFAEIVSVLRISVFAENVSVFAENVLI